MNLLRKYQIIGLLFVVLFTHLYAQKSEDNIRLSARVEPDTIGAGGKGMLVVECEISPGFHIADARSGFFEVVPEEIDGMEFGKPDYPDGVMTPSGFSYYEGRVGINIPISVKEGIGAGEKNIVIRVRVQQCSIIDGTCYRPEEKFVKAIVFISDTDTFSSISAETGGIAGRLSGALEQGSVFAFIIVFLGGLLTSLTPCVYPMIPITLAVIGAQASGGKFKGFVLSLFYVLGISTTFTTLGVIAAKTGSLFGSLTHHPAVTIFVSMIFFFMGLSMLGLFVLQMPSSIASKIAGKRGRGFVGAFLTGLLAGLIVSPCISPLLVVILTWVARTGSVLMGIGLLLSFSLGLGVLFIVIGTFSGIIKNMPKSGGWMEWIERGFGITLVVLSIILIRPVMPQLIYNILWALFFIVFGTFIGAFYPVNRDSSLSRKIGKAAGIVAIMMGAIFLYFGFASCYGGVDVMHMQPSSQITSQKGMWLESDEDGFREAEMTGENVIIDFFAEWCGSCHEMDEKTWSNKSVISELNRYVLVKLDLTENNQRTKSIQKRYNIIGMPTVIIFDPKRNELHRFTGFKGPEETLKILKKY